MARVWYSSIAVPRIAKLLFILALLVGAAGCTGGVDESALADRVANFQPTWESYQEEAKGYIGARPVAEWEGDPLSVEIVEHAARVTFSVQGPWAIREFAMPVLLRGPDLPARLPASAEVANRQVIYSFPLESTALISWVEVQYPRGEKRLRPSASD